MTAGIAPLAFPPSEGPSRRRSFLQAAVGAAPMSVGCLLTKHAVVRRSTPGANTGRDHSRRRALCPQLCVCVGTQRGWKEDPQPHGSAVPKAPSPTAANELGSASHAPRIAPSTAFTSSLHFTSLHTPPSSSSLRSARRSKGLNGEVRAREQTKHHASCKEGISYVNIEEGGGPAGHGVSHAAA